MHFSFGDVHLNMYPSGMYPMPEEPADETGASANPSAPSAKPAVVLTLPPIALSELKPQTKAYLLRRAGADRGPWERMKKLLDRGAERQREGSVVGGQGSVVREQPRTTGDAPSPSSFSSLSPDP